VQLTDILIVAFPLVWIGGFIAASVIYRTARDKPVFPAVPDDALYAEGWGSGRNRSTWWGSLGGASNCLIIAITPDRLVAVPRFPFSLMFLPEIYGLELDIPLKEIMRIERKRLLWRNMVLITFRDGRRFEFMPRRVDDFMAALGSRGA
jgi:hypothetical protein